MWPGPPPPRCPRGGTSPRYRRTGRSGWREIPPLLFSPPPDGLERVVIQEREPPPGEVGGLRPGRHHRFRPHQHLIRLASGRPVPAPLQDLGIAARRIERQRSEE